jgi:nitrogen regulatory protein PII
MRVIKRENLIKNVRARIEESGNASNFKETFERSKSTINAVRIFGDKKKEAKLLMGMHIYTCYCDELIKGIEESFEEVADDTNVSDTRIFITELAEDDKRISSLN